MSNSHCSPDLRKGMQGQYTLNSRVIFEQAWVNLYGFKASFWKAFILGFLTLLLINCTAYVIFYLLAVLIKAVIHNSDVLQWIFLIYLFVALLCLFFGEALYSLFIISLTHCSLQWLRNQSIKAKDVFAFRARWKPLIGLMLVFSLINITLSFVQLVSLDSPGLFLHALSAHHSATWFSFFTWLIFYLFFVILFFLASLYCILLFSFAALLSFDKRTMDIKTSLRVAFKALNARLISHLRLFLLAILIFMLGTFLTLGIAVIWLVPWFSLVIALQYQTIFGERNDEIPENEQNGAIVT
jgi:hypothetical protein